MVRNGVQNIRLQEEAERYLAEQRSQSTRRAKRSDLLLFFDFLGDKLGVEKPNLSHWTKEGTSEFLSYLSDKGDAPSTSTRRLATLKHFGKRLSEEYAARGFVDPTRGFALAKVTRERPFRLSDRILREIWRVVEKSSPSFKEARSAAIVTLFADVGLKLEEALSLRPIQVDLRNSQIDSIGGNQGNPGRRVILNSRARRLIDQYLDLRQAEISRIPGASRITRAQELNLPFLISLYGATLDDPDSLAINSKTARRLVGEVVDQIPKIETEELGTVNPSTLRDSFIYRLIEFSRNPALVAEVVGVSASYIVEMYLDSTEGNIETLMEELVEL